MEHMSALSAGRVFNRAPNVYLLMTVCFRDHPQSPLPLGVRRNPVVIHLLLFGYIFHPFRRPAHVAPSSNSTHAGHHFEFWVT